ncbi:MULTISPECIES: NAD-dependent succinate-semialdehyde dehydrogenase [unclassified Novosphingobium]|uniref:NAD-dependent succinate-semialdehyde dehydrogenase n=1 Tax=unclassified Novosphingobium TaxID=2644732 RepID=UPI001446AA4E|nr:MULTISPECIES: NAD-dependent succinate-semialdehyde dehydrogenase [unclassified Novosphingobium]NKJ44249.1 succinate-semialdehyde dehydrogenase/glutarate-semialdehyde dehydrogenase [Novosphingobium sp. SG720]NMN05023.1 succinate-semialdehyde dehydrogenase/glutarate-semialdehyde dehydrogenase [Novosphingobium sp. SG919]NMN87317.1 succinate-semialdehyde dehydrogenase/glutarate-semialdehyde dehydrogenase [Novosphingobium sp. SG916]
MHALANPVTDRFDDLYLFIDGEWVEAGNRDTSAVINPANGCVVGRVPHATHDDVERALAATQRAFKLWSGTPAYDRAKVLKRAAELIRQRATHIEWLMTTEQGKALSEAKYEVASAADYFEWFAEQGKRAYGRVVPSRRPEVQQIVKRQPIGPVAAFTPWNFPAITPARKLAAALAAGCSVIIKPGEECPATALAIGRALEDAGLPKGVVQILFGVPADISAHLIASPIIRKVTFTGSVPVGRLLAAQAAQGVKPITLELGGHGPVLVFNDADLDAAARLGAANRFRGTGQICISSTRFLVQSESLDTFTEKFVAATQALKVGSGHDPATQVGPLSNPRQVEKTQSLIDDAVARGARILTGGKPIPGPGFFFEPTVLTDVPLDARVMQEEPFGPIAIIRPFDTFENGMKEANRLPYALGGYVFTQDARTAIRAGDELEAGMIGINHFSMIVSELPFGGFKESGYGSEGGEEGIDNYLVTKFISQI